MGNQMGNQMGQFPTFATSPDGPKKRWEPKRVPLVGGIAEEGEDEPADGSRSESGRGGDQMGNRAGWFPTIVASPGGPKSGGSENECPWWAE